MEFVFMVAVVLGVALGICVAVACVKFYRRGVNDGMAVFQHEELPIDEPKPVKETPATNEEKAMMDRYEAILAYNPYNTEGETNG
jgi:hypothetical protein